MGVGSLRRVPGSCPCATDSRTSGCGFRGFCAFWAAWAENAPSEPRVVPLGAVAPGQWAQACPPQVYFRLHASILKLLGKPDSGVGAEVLVSFMKEAAEGPFARGEEKSTPRASEK